MVHMLALPQENFFTIYVLLVIMVWYFSVHHFSVGEGGASSTGWVKLQSRENSTECFVSLKDGIPTFADWHALQAKSFLLPFTTNCIVAEMQTSFNLPLSSLSGQVEQQRGKLNIM